MKTNKDLVLLIKTAEELGLEYELESGEDMVNGNEVDIEDLFRQTKTYKVTVLQNGEERIKLVQAENEEQAKRIVEHQWRLSKGYVTDYSIRAEEV